MNFRMTYNNITVLTFEFSFYIYYFVSAFDEKKERNTL